MNDAASRKNWPRQLGPTFRTTCPCGDVLRSSRLVRSERRSTYMSHFDSHHAGLTPREKSVAVDELMTVEKPDV